jgi:proline dehydrogenase
MRRVLLWAARNRWLREHLSRWRFVKRAVRRFMPGEEMADALAAAEAYRDAGIGSAFTLLGENLTVFAEAERVAEHYHRVLDEVTARGLGTEVSVKLTQIGFDIDVERAFALFDALARRAAERGTWVWIDMEGSAYTEGTIAFYERAARNHRNVGLCLQAYLHRTPSDVARLVPLAPAIRLVKGAYDEPASIAYRSRPEVDAAYLGLAVGMLEALAGERMTRVILATHDSRLVEQVARFAEAAGLPRARIAVQMLYGIRAGELRRLAAAGFAVSGLIAYGTFWYPWYMRRLAERPANVIFALRQILP